jgi:hypothetical protein
MPTRSGALSYGGGKPGVVQAGTLLPVDEPMICRPIDVVAHQNASIAVNGLSGRFCDHDASRGAQLGRAAVQLV